MKTATLALLLMIALAGALCAHSPAGDVSAHSHPPTMTLDQIAEGYVKLVLAIGQYSPDMVDSYSGPPEWKAEAEKNKKSSFPYLELRGSVDQLRNALAELNPLTGGDDLVTRRWDFLRTQLSAMDAAIELLNGKKMTFDEESFAVYNSVAEVRDEAWFTKHLERLETILPGKGDLQERLFAYREQFKIPKDKVAAVFEAAIAECRKRSLTFASLPASESFKTEFVTGKPWSAYNWYKGKAFSLIQVNLDMPQYINVPLALAAHEGYPGHHVYNALLEDLLQKGKGWIEFSIYALFSPQSLIAEGTAEYAIETIFTPKEKLDFLEKTLFPLAGLDPARAKEYEEVMDLTKKLNYAMTEAARRFIDGKMDEKQAVEFLVKYNLVPRDRAEKKLAFIKQYRSYVVNYTLGEDLVRAYIQRAGRTATPSTPQAASDVASISSGTETAPIPAEQVRKLFLGLLTRPTVPADLRETR